MKHALDSNIVVAALNGNPRVRRRLDALLPSDVIVPAIVLAELFYGARHSVRGDASHARVTHLAQRVTAASLGAPEADRFGAIKAALADAGRIKADVDLLIAATAVMLDAVLVTDDRSLHDAALPGLAVQNWLEDPAG